MQKLILILMTSLIFAGCVGHKKYVGRTVNYHHNNLWCINNGEPCRVFDNTFLFEYTITEKNGKYTIEGTIDPTQGNIKSWSTFQSQGTRFSLILVGEDNVVFDNVPIPVILNISRKMTFSKKIVFEKKISAIFIDWQCYVRG